MTAPDPSPSRNPPAPPASRRLLFLRRAFLGVLLAGSVGAWLVLLWVERLYRQEGANYSLIEPGLFMGGDVEEPPPGTRAVLNLCEKEDPYHCATHVWVPIADTAPPPSIDWLRAQVEFMAAQRRAGVTVFVHCRNGVSRSGLVVAAYEMFKNRWSRDEALAFVRSKRPITRPNSAFMELLLEWERVLQEKSGQRTLSEAGGI
jgi:Dual specificity phosphatase, catalytic domain